MDSPLVIGITGHTGAGKTTLAQSLRTECGFQYFRYSLVLAEWRKVDPAAKGSLQELGWGVMAAGNQRELNRLLINQIDRGQDCVVDGLRHIIDYESLKMEFPRNFALIFLKATAQTRFDRTRQRYPAYASFLKADSHPVESSIDSLLPLANLVLDSEKSTSEIVESTISFCSSFRRLSEENL